MRRSHVETAILMPIIALSLAACGGGSLARSDPGTTTLPTTPTSGAWVNPMRITLSTDAAGAPAKNVMVGVVDTGFLVTHFEIKDRVVAAQEFEGTGTLEDNKTPHGTEVAMLIAGRIVGFSGNADLVLAKVADTNSVMYTDKISTGTQWAMDQGAKVMNFSIGSMYIIDPVFITPMYQKAVERDVVMVLAAGNETKNVSTISSAAGSTSIFAADNESFKNISLIVGASNGNDKASYANYAGEDPNVQSRFLVADAPNYVQKRDATATATSTSGLALFDGTSSTTAVVTAAAATVRAYWPHLKAQQSAQILLDSADKTFSSLYSLSNCGSTGNVNCGFYTFGQGKVNLRSVMQPVGTTTIPVGGTLGSASYTVSATSLVLPAAFGDALSGKSITAALFDGYGRDFQFDLSSRFSSSPGASFANILFSQMDGTSYRREDEQVAARADFDRRGAVTQARFDLKLGRHVAHFQYGKGSALDPYDSPMPMASLAGSDSLARYGQTYGFGLTWHLGDSLALEGQTTIAGTTGPTGDGKLGASRQKMGVSFRLAPSTTFTFAYATMAEDRAMLGAPGTGALGLAGSRLQSTVLKLRSDLGQGWTAFGQAELSTLNVQGQGILTRIAETATTQFGAGLAWSEGNRRVAFAVSQPIRVESATAQFVLPAGRTLDGEVLRKNETLALSPSGRQVNFEMALQQRLDRTSSFSLNAVHARDFGHVAGKREWTVMGVYRRAL